MLGHLLTLCTPCTWSNFPLLSLWTLLSQSETHSMHSLRSRCTPCIRVSKEKQLKLIQFGHKLMQSTSRTIIHEWNEINDIHRMQHSFNHTFKWTQSKIWDNCVCSIHSWNKLHILQFLPASFFYSILLYWSLSSYLIILLQYNNKLSKDWLHEVSRPVCNLSYHS